MPAVRQLPQAPSMNPAKTVQKLTPAGVGGKAFDIQADSAYIQELLQTLTQAYGEMHQHILLASRDNAALRPTANGSDDPSNRSNTKITLAEAFEPVRDSHQTRGGDQGFVPAIDLRRESKRLESSHTQPHKTLEPARPSTASSAVPTLILEPGRASTASSTHGITAMQHASTTSNVRVKQDVPQFGLVRSLVSNKAAQVEESWAMKGKINRQELTQTPYFDLVMGLLILANVAVIAVEAQIDGYKVAHKAGIEPYYDEWDGASVLFVVLDYVFCVIFALEIMYRAWYHGSAYFKEALGFFELTIVLQSVVELFVLEPMRLGSGQNFSLLRVTRLFRLMRLMRLVRVFKLINSLRILAKTIVSSMTSLGWAMVLLGLIVCSAGLVACQLLSGTIQDPSVDMELRSWLFRHYGTSTRSAYSVFEATLSGCWPNYARPLIDKVNGYWSIFWILYSSFVVFAVISVMRAIFLKETLQNAMGDPDSMIQEQVLKKDAYRKKLKDAFESIDIEGNGEITEDDFELIMKVPKVQALMSVLDFEFHDAHVVFQMLEEDNDGAIQYTEFLSGIMRLRGWARQIDVVSIQRDCKYLMECIHTLTEAFEKANRVTLPKRQTRKTSRAPAILENERAS